MQCANVLVIYYLTNGAISNVLGSIAKVAEPKSEVIFDFLVPEECVDLAYRDVYDSTVSSWLGVIYYLTNGAISNVLGSIAKVAEPKSEVIFDFLVPEECVDLAYRDVYDSTCAYTARLGEPYVSFQSPADIEGLAKTAGFEVVSIISDADLDHQYFRDRQDDLAVMRGCGIAHLMGL